MLGVEYGGSNGARLITRVPFSAGDVIGSLAHGREVDRPTYHSIQTGPGAHIDDLGLFAYLNHSCRPNVIVDTSALDVVAARDIAAGEELTFFYPSTEWDMQHPFVCRCGTPECIGTVSGAKHVARETLDRYFINAHIRLLAAGSPPTVSDRTMKTIALICPNSWDEVQLAASRPVWGQKYRVELHGEDVEGDPSTFDACGFIDDAVSRLRCRNPHPVHGVASSSDYPGCLVASAIARELGLPGPAPDRVLLCSHKYYARLAQQAAAPEATPPFALIDPDAPGPDGLEIPFPLFVKPVKSWFSVLAQRMDTFAELRAFAGLPAVRAHLSQFVAPFNRLVRRYTTFDVDGSYLLAEQLLEGPLVTVEGFVCRGEVEIIGIVDSVMHPGTISFQRFDYPSSLPAEVQVRMAEIAARVIRHIGLDESLFNVEMVYNREADRIHIVEINPRMCGQFADLWESVHGINTYEILFSLAAGEKPRFRRDRGRFKVAASFPLRAFEDKRVIRVPDEPQIETIKRAFPVTIVKTYYREGERLSDRNQGDGQSYRYGVVNMAGDDRPSLLASFEEVRRRLGFSFGEIY